MIRPPCEHSLLEARGCFEQTIPKSPKLWQTKHDILKLESEFPALSGQAFAKARARVLDSGQSVLQSSEGVIYEVFPDGTKRAVKEIEPPTLVEPRSKFRIG